ncbi:hypothetical protein [Aquimarina longa]|uniref:hypothetical protein n=1 Tax=Aquimarina longa TaxID=1080221 RepID=UPI000780D3FA|nr:hypothetical protein [Aquimarina longa]
MKKFKFKPYNWDKVSNPKKGIYSFYSEDQEKDINFSEMDYNRIRAFLIEAIYSKSTTFLYCQFSFNSKDKPYGFFGNEYYIGNDLFVKDSPKNIINFFLSFDKVIGNSIFIKFEKEISLNEFLLLEKKCFSLSNRLKRIFNLSVKWIEFWKTYSNDYLVFYLMSGGFDYYSDKLDTIVEICPLPPDSPSV